MYMLHVKRDVIQLSRCHDVFNVSHDVMTLRVIRDMHMMTHAHVLMHHKRVTNMLFCVTNTSHAMSRDVMHVRL